MYLHEVGVHQGLRAFIGENFVNQLARQIYDWAGSDVAAVHAAFVRPRRGRRVCVVAEIQ